MIFILAFLMRSSLLKKGISLTIWCMQEKKNIYFNNLDLTIIKLIMIQVVLIYE